MEEKEHVGIFLFAFEMLMLAIWASACVSDGKRAPELRALWLGFVVFVSRVCQW